MVRDHPWIQWQEFTTGETVERSVRTDNYFGCGRSCHIRLLSRISRSPYGARRTCVLAYRTFGAVWDIPSSGDRVLATVYAVVIMTVLLLALRHCL